MTRLRAGKRNYGHDDRIDLFDPLPAPSVAPNGSCVKQ
jgi:hypothetical protein